MSEVSVSAEQLGKRAHECGLLTINQVQLSLNEAGGPDIATYEDFISVLMQKELLTNWQIERLAKGEIQGYFFGKWKILYFIGAGTFARVYRAVQIETGDVKAVKVLRVRHSNDDETREQFMREANMVMQLRHPNITPIFEVEQFKGRIYMVMDFVQGQNLRDYFKAHRKISHLRSLAIVRDIAAGLAYAFERNITHRDLKLSNVLLSAKGQAKLVDFGLAVGGDDTGDSKTPRSIDYATLEKVSGAKRDDKRSDLFFLGCMLYEMVTGQPPLEETRERMRRMSSQRFTDIVPITVHDPNLPDRLVIFANRLMELDPKKRIQTPALAKQEAEAVIESIESGNVKKYDAEASGKAAAEYEKQMLLKEEGRGYTIMLIESNAKLQDVLRDRLKELGYRVLITNDPGRGLERFMDMNADGDEDDLKGCVIFGCVGLGREAMQACYSFSANRETKHVPSLMIITEKLKRHVNHDLIGDRHQVLCMPVKFKHVQIALRKILGIKLPSA